ncbi:unnamed protein product [Owenia fusiformis]|uniref:Uncharacterized protein n=1 Tax=Owenia fusiformis TaxID=6347 RepID=A0A8J1UYW7_OWEFU|nr:unnamed protein product [Owenia fusiformis]
MENENYDAAIWNGILFGGVTIAIIICRILYNHITSRLPPTLPWLPKVGSIPFINTENRLEMLVNLKQKYGDACMMYLGTRPVVMLNSYQAIQEILVRKGNHFNHRPYLLGLNELLNSKDQDSFITSSGSTNEKMHRFTDDALEVQLHPTTGTFQSNLQEELKVLFKEIDALKGKAVDYEELLLTCCSNVMNRVLIGKRLEVSSTAFQQQLQAHKDNIEALCNSKCLTVDPTLRFIPGFRGAYDTLKWAADTRRNIGEGLMNVRGQGGWLQLCEMNANKPKGAVWSDDISESTLKLMIQDCHTGGTETMARTLNTALMYMAINPSIQKQLQDEIDKVIGGATIKMADQQRLPLVQATILEILRLSPMLPLGMPHMSHQDNTVAGYLIPKETVVFPNIYAIHHDEALWENAEEFKPRRFLDANGKLSQTAKSNLLTFSLGNRKCPGEQLADQQLFLMMTSLLQRYYFVTQSKIDNSHLKQNMGLMLHAQPIKLCVRAR